VHGLGGDSIEPLQTCSVCGAVRQQLVVITGRGLHSKDNLARLFHGIGEYLCILSQELNIAHTEAVGAYVVEVFKDGERAHPPSKREAMKALQMVNKMN
jgi:hypothetical protein